MKVFYARIKRFWQHVSPNLKGALLCFFCAGFLLLYLANRLEKSEWSQTLHELGVLYVTVTPILFFYEVVLRQHLQIDTANILAKVIQETGLHTEVLNILERTLPTSFRHLLNYGISDAYPDLDSKHMRDCICAAHDTEIKIVKIWIPFLNEAIDSKTIFDSIVARNCTYKIILSNPENIEPLQKRAVTTKYSLQYYTSQIAENISFFHSIWKDLKRIGHEKKLQIRLHQDFIGVSLISFADYSIFGLYLHGRVATRGMQFKIDKIVNESQTEFYGQLNEHFAQQWEMASNEVGFNELEFRFQERSVVSREALPTEPTTLYQ